MGSGTAFLGIWNDLAHGHEAEYEAWHTREHVPERVGVPGFRSGRRYVAPDHPTHRWFTLYELAGLDCLETPEYRDLIENPTPWSAAMRQHFRNFLRAPCAPLGSCGEGIGGALAVLRLPDDGALNDLPALARQPGVVAARLGRRADGQGAMAAFRVGAPGSGAPDDFAFVLLLEALQRAAADQALAWAARRFLRQDVPGQDAGGVYELAFIFPGSDPSEAVAHRRPRPPPA